MLGALADRVLAVCAGCAWLLLAGLLTLAGGMAAGGGFAQAQSLTTITDSITGVRFGLPRSMVNGPFSAKFGNNWKASDDRINIDTLNFRGQRSLNDVYESMRGFRGRTITRATNDGTSFAVQGIDRDGGLIYVVGTQRGGEVRGLSIVYRPWARADLEPIVAAMVRSFEPFPDAAPQAPPPVTAPPVRQTPAAPPATAAPALPQPDPRVAEMQEELRRMRAALDEAKTAAARPAPPPAPSLNPEVERLRAEVEALRKQERDALNDRIARLEAEVKDARTKGRPAAVPSAAAVPLAGPLPPGKRVAMVVGINDYAELPRQQLERAVNDARLMQQTLQRLGFEVMPVGENLDRRRFVQAWQAFMRKIEPGSTAAFFFAGHGVQVAGVNFLLPGDVPNIENDGAEALQLHSLNLTQLHSDMLARKPKVSLLIIDACRDNPFTPRGVARGGITGTRGLSNVNHSIEGSFVLFSAAANEQAWDSLPSDDPSEANSVFTRVLAPLLLKPDVTIQDIARQVKIGVAEKVSAHDKRQSPTYYDGLTGEVCLLGNCRLARR